MLKGVPDLHAPGAEIDVGGLEGLRAVVFGAGGLLPEAEVATADDVTVDWIPHQVGRLLVRVGEPLEDLVGIVEAVFEVEVQSQRATELPTIQRGYPSGLEACLWSSLVWWLGPQLFSCS